MRRLAGVVTFDSRPVADDDEAWLGAEAVFRAPGVAMVSDATDAAGNACGWDGRLDSHHEGALPAAAALVRYGRHGPDGFHDLIGDWSLALWDAVRRKVVLASDYAGIRPLYYARAGGRLAWSSSLADLVSRTGAHELDEDYAAGFLLRGHARGRTPYRGVFPAPAGEAICLDGQGGRTHRFWDLPCGDELRLAGEAEYQERLLELFREAVAVRVRSQARVCAELSGGLDSSSVVAMAARLGSSLATISYLHEGSGDEKYFRAMERHCGLPALHLPLDDYSFTAPDQTGGAAPAFWEPRFRRLAPQLEALGATAFLTGQLGDFTMGNTLDDSGQTAGYLRRGRLGEALGEAYEWSQALGIPIYPVLWRALRMSLSGWTPTGPEMSAVSSSSPAAANSLTERLRRRIAELDGSRDSSWRLAPPERRQRLRALGDLAQARTLQTPEPLLAYSYAHPFAHRPLVEFMLSIPPGVVCRPGEPRRLMRRAFTGLLPEAVLQRRSKAYYAATFRKTLAPMAAEMLRGGAIRIVEMGYAERESLLSRLERFTQGVDSNEVQLRNLILFEFWLRNREKRM